MRKFFDKPKKATSADLYDIAVAYIKSNFLLDFVVSFFSCASGLDLRFVTLKFLRLYQVQLLHYPCEILVNCLYRERDTRQRYVITYASSTVCKVLMLLHYLAIVWLWIGSDSFLTYEAGYLPWNFAISDFEGYSGYKLYVFSVYWVCTVVTTVGYGDYAGGTTLELLYTILLEFLGLAVFSVF